MKQLFFTVLLACGSSYASRQLTPHQEQALGHIALFAQVFGQHAQEAHEAAQKKALAEKKRNIRTQKQEQHGKNKYNPAQKNISKKTKNRWQN